MTLCGHSGIGPVLRGYFGCNQNTLFWAQMSVRNDEPLLCSFLRADAQVRQTREQNRAHHLIVLTSSYQAERTTSQYLSATPRRTATAFRENPPDRSKESRAASRVSYDSLVIRVPAVTVSWYRLARFAPVIGEMLSTPWD
jgi:type III secretory pathway component EscR